MAKDIEVDFNILRYANCWEDADVLLKGLSPKPGSKILSIGSAGDNSFSLLTADPQLVVAVDISPVQLHLIELKKACFANLTHEQTLAFLGFSPSEERIETYKLFLRNALPADAVVYWDSNLQSINDGIIYKGKFEKYLLLFGQKILPYIHSKKNTLKLFEQKNQEQQQAFYYKIWNSWRWKMLFRIFFSSFVMGRFGRDPKFLKEVKINVSKYIYKQAEKCLGSAEITENNYLRFMLLGSFGNVLPHYLREENYEIIKANLHKLKCVKGYVQHAKEFGPYQYFNLSNIFEYMDYGSFKNVAGQIIEMASPNAKLAYWNLMVPRKINSIMSAETTYLQKLSHELHAQDKCFFYSKFITEEVN